MFDFGFGENVHYVLIFFIASILSIIGYSILRKYLLKVTFKIISKTQTRWNSILINSGVFEKISYMVPVLIFSYFIHLLPENIATPLWRVIAFLSAVILILSIERALSAFLGIYNTYPISKDKPIKGYIQLVKIVLYILGTIISVCLLVGISPWGVLSGIGALTAVLMFVFKDTILSLVASIQIVANDLFKVGDWIEVPGFGADGDVIDIALHSVKVQNFDKTIINIPTYKFLDSSFKNWRGMQSSGGRRIKRHLLIDLGTVKFLTKEEIEKFKEIEILQGYFESKKDLLEHYDNEVLNSRKLSNIGTFRAYVKEYLNRCPHINNIEFTFLVRQLQPTSKGLPLEIYVFSNDNRWVAYEDIQSDIFDHLIVATKEFGLKLYQEPTGDLSIGRV